MNKEQKEREEQVKEMMRIAACSNCISKVEDGCSTYKACKYRDGFRGPIENLVNAGYGNLQVIKELACKKVGELKTNEWIKIMLASGFLVEAESYLVTLPKNVVLDDYDKERIRSITCEDIEFKKGQRVYKVYDSVTHFANRKTVKPKYELLEGIVKDVYHKYDSHENTFRVTVEVEPDKGKTYKCFSQVNMFADKDEAQARFKELQEKLK